MLWSELATGIPALLETIQADMLAKARANMDDGIVKVSSWAEETTALNKKKLIMAPWCQETSTEDEMKDKSNAEALEMQTEDETALTGAMKSLCIPLNQPPLPAGTKCFWTGKPAKTWCLFGRSY